MSALPPKADIKIARIALGVVASATWHDPPRPGRMYAGRGLLRSLIVRERKRGRLPRDGLADLGS